MRFFKLDKLGDMDPDDCFLANPPEGTEDHTYRMAEGDRMGPKFPANARIYMDDEHTGMRLTSIIGNDNSFFIASAEVKTIVEKLHVGEVEYLPVSIYNHKKRKSSGDYFIINPIGNIDCLDLKASKINYLGDRIVAVKEFVLDPEKLADGLDLFRPKEDRRQYILSETLVDALQTLPASNLVLDEVKVSSGGKSKR